VKLDAKIFLTSITKSDPHAVMKNFMIYFFRYFVDHISPDKNLHTNLGKFYIDNGPGKGFGESTPQVTGYYDWEEMDELNIEEFEKHSAYVVSHEQFVDFDIVMYSRREFEGLLTLSLREFYKQHPEWRSKFEQVEQEFYDRDAVYLELIEKLEGKIPWEHGPLGVSEEKAKQWHAIHSAGNSAKYIADKVN